LEFGPNLFSHSYAIAAIKLGLALQLALTNQKQTKKNPPSR